MAILEIPGFSEPFSSLSHLIAAFFFFVGGFFLVSKGRGNKLRIGALILYTFSLVFLFSMSGVYHLLEPKGDARYVLRHLDYAGIWVLIAGSFVPIHIILFRGIKRWAVLLPVSIISITSLTLQMVFFDSIPEFLSLGMFLLLGWFGGISAILIARSYSINAVKPLCIGGAFYTVGALMEFLRWPVIIEGVLGPHEVFHLFVIAGAFMHWKFILDICHRPISPVLVFQIQQNIKKKKFFGVGLNERFMVLGDSESEVVNQVEVWISGNYSDEMKPLKSEGRLVTSF